LRAAKWYEFQIRRTRRLHGVPERSAARRAFVAQQSDSRRNCAQTREERDAHIHW
jgi:hypothetical protein